MRAEEDIAGQVFEDGKAALVVRCDLRIGLVAGELVAGIHVGAADDDDVQDATVLFLVHRPGRCAFGVARSEVRGENRAAEAHRVAVVQHAVDVSGRELHGMIRAVLKIGFAAGLDDRDVGIHDGIFGASEADDLGAAGAVVVVRMADEQNLDVFKVEAKGFNAFTNERH